MERHEVPGRHARRLARQEGRQPQAWLHGHLPNPRGATPGQRLRARHEARPARSARMDVRWINTWHDPVKEKEGAASLFDAGAQVVFTGADTPAPADVAQEKGKWGITYDWVGSLQGRALPDRAVLELGPDLRQDRQGGERRHLQARLRVLRRRHRRRWACTASWRARRRPRAWPTCRAEVIQQVKDTLAEDAEGRVHALRRLRRPDQGQHRQGDRAGRRRSWSRPTSISSRPGAPGCKYCMHWWAEGITAELPALQ